MTVRIALATLALAAALVPDAHGSDIHPDVALGLVTTVESPAELAAILGQYLSQHGFSLDGRVRAGPDSYLRATFKDNASGEVSISGHYPCFAVGFYLAHEPAMSLRDGLVQYVKSLWSPAISARQVRADDGKCGDAL